MIATKNGADFLVKFQALLLEGTILCTVSVLSQQKEDSRFTRGIMIEDDGRPCLEVPFKLLLTGQAIPIAVKMTTRCTVGKMETG